MLDIKWIRDNPEALDRALENRGAEPAAATLIALDEARRAHIVKLEEAQARRNAASKEIGKAKAAKDEAEAQRLMAEVGGAEDLPAGGGGSGKGTRQGAGGRAGGHPQRAAGGRAGRRRTRKPTRSIAAGATSPACNDAKEHYELGEALGQMDFETAAKLSGARFVVLKKGLARMERALGQFMLDLHTTEHGYEEVQPPLLVRDEVMFGTAQLPKFRDDQFMHRLRACEKLNAVSGQGLQVARRRNARETRVAQSDTRARRNIVT